MKTIYLPSIYSLTPQMLNGLGVKCLFLDVDNTIKKYNDPDPNGKTKELIGKLHSAGVDIVLCSNNTKSSVKPFADKLGCKFVSFALKPSPFGMIRAQRKTRARHKEILLIGDQVFNDILAGKLFGIKTMLVDPIDRENEPSTVTARRKLFGFFERRIRDNRNLFKEGQK